MSENPTVDPMRIAGDPTKEFFIYMLTKDIGLTRSILDLVDNSIDGARRQRPDSNYAGLEIRLNTSTEAFRIQDNCGGIPVEIARKYAFRFGRPPGMQKTDHSVGQFGVGMKRAVFKLGNHFRVESRDDSAYFVVDVPVSAWRDSPDWDFHFAELNEASEELPAIPAGTTVVVDQLHDAVKQEFALATFDKTLRLELEAAHQGSMNKGIRIYLNDREILFRPAALLKSDAIQPFYKVITLDEHSKDKPITVRLYAGIADSSPDSAGWFIFCNDRLVLEADQTNATGWGEGGGTTIPKFHNQFARFRGYAFFDCADAEYLPWNTTKTGVDRDSAIYIGIRREMIAMMRPIIDFLNQLDAEKSGGTQTSLGQAVEAARPARLDSVLPTTLFTFARVPSRPSGPKTQNIQYSRPAEQIEKVKKALNATSLKQVGEKTFDYFYELECED